MPSVEFQPLLTTVVGSYPSGGLPPRRAIHRAVEDQIAAGVELISDGQMRGDMIATFASRIPGFRLADDGVWEIVDALDLPADPITVQDYALARTLAGGRAQVKGIVTGPSTLALACRISHSAPYSEAADPALLLRLAEILSREVAALVAAGATVVQIDEPIFATALGERISPELAYDALRGLVSSPRLPMLHVCGDVRAIAEELLILPFAALSIENTRIANLAAFDPDELSFSSARLCPGVVDTQTDEVESPETLRQRIRDALERVEGDRLWIAPDCGLRLLSPEAAKAKLTRMVAAAHEVRAEL